MRVYSYLQRVTQISFLAILGACASGGGKGDAPEGVASGADELESLAASLDNGTASAPKAESESQINEGDLLANDLKDGSPAPAAKDSGDLALDDAAPAADRSGVDTGAGGALWLTASGSVSMSLENTPWLSAFDSNAMGFDCKWKTLKDNGKIRHRVCSIEKKVVINVLEKNRGTGPQLAKLVLDEHGKAAFNRWQKGLRDAHYRGGKEKHRGANKTVARYMSGDHRSFVDLIWNEKASAATLIMTPTAKGLGRELKKVAQSN